MKSQNDLIISIVAGVVALIAAIAFFMTKREPVAPPAPTAVNLAAPKLPEASVAMANALPGGGGAGGGGGMMGGPPGMSGPGMMGGGRAPGGAAGGMSFGGGRAGGGRGPMGAL